MARNLSRGEIYHMGRSDKMGRPRSKPSPQIKKRGGKKEEDADKNSAAQPPRKRGRPKKEERTADVKVNKKKGAGISKSKETKRGLVVVAGQGKKTKKEIAKAAQKDGDTLKKGGKKAVGKDKIKTTRGRKGTAKVETSHIHEEKVHTSNDVVGVQQTSAMGVKEEVSQGWNAAGQKVPASCDEAVQNATNGVEQMNNMDAKEEGSDRKAAQIDGPSKKVGVHVSMSGGLHNAVENALRMDAKAFGLFLRNQRQWASKPLSDEDADKFKKAYTDANYSPDVILPHGIYLMNCASPDDDALQKSRETLIDELKRCEKLGLTLYNFHPGSTCGKISVDEGVERIAKSINDAHRETKFVVTLIENMCCQGHTVSILTKSAGFCAHKRCQELRKGHCHLQ